MRDIDPPAIVSSLDEEQAAGLRQYHAEHDRAVKAGRCQAEASRNAGRELIKLRKTVPPGHWLKWLAANTRTSARTAQRYIRAASPQASDKLSHIRQGVASEADDILDLSSENDASQGDAMRQDAPVASAPAQESAQAPCEPSTPAGPPGAVRPRCPACDQPLKIAPGEAP